MCGELGQGQAKGGQGTRGAGGIPARGHQAPHPHPRDPLPASETHSPSPARALQSPRAPEALSRHAAERGRSLAERLAGGAWSSCAGATVGEGEVGTWL